MRANVLRPETGEIVTIRQPGNVHDGARCVYIGPWSEFHYVLHLHDSPTRSAGGALWYAKGQQTGWGLENLHLDPVIRRASFCAGCEEWIETNTPDFLCQGCRDAS